MTVFLVEHRRNIPNIAVEVKAYVEPLLHHTTTSTVLFLNYGQSTSLQLAWDSFIFLPKKTREEWLYQSQNYQMHYRVMRNLQRVFFSDSCVYCLFQFLKAVITPEFLLILDYRNLNLEHWLFNELASQLAGEGQLVTYSLPFEFRAIEAILQYRVSYLIFKLFWKLLLHRKDNMILFLC